MNDIATPPPAPPTPAAPPILAGTQLRQAYHIGKRGLEVLRGVELAVAAGETVAIMGASGAGKSTLLNVLGGLDRPTAGQVFFRGQDVYRLSNRARSLFRARAIGFVFQSYHLLPELDITENVMLAAMSAHGAWLRAGRLRQRAVELLARVGLQERIEHRPAELSGGEQQRVALARALMNDPPLILADEPTGNLDSETGDLILRYLFELRQDQNKTLVLVTHNRAVADRCARTLVLKDGRLLADGGGDHSQV